MPGFREYEVPLPLQGLIRTLHYFEMDFAHPFPGQPAPYITCLANTEQNLYLLPCDPLRVVAASGQSFPAPPAIITGPKDRPVGLAFGNNHLMIKLAFYPTALYRLTGMDMRQTVNMGLDAALFFPGQMTALLQSVRQLQAQEERISTIFAFVQTAMAHKCRPEEPIDRVARAMLDPMENLSPVEWAAKACMSSRQFERQFLTRVGISPKLFLRIVRFEYAMQIKAAHPNCSWADIALQSGYADSPHLQKDFRSFAEFAPGALYNSPNSGNGALPTG